MVAAQQYQSEYAVDAVHQCLDLVDRGVPQFGQRGDGPHTGRRKGLRGVAGRLVLQWIQGSGSPFHVGGVAAAVTDRHVVLAGVGRHHELNGGASAHRS